MERKEIGQWVKVVSFKHDGTFHRSWDKTCLIRETDDYLIFVNSRADIMENDGRLWTARDPAISLFFKKQFYNIICMIRHNGIYYYCNVASPYMIEEGVIKYIDYDLDISLSPLKSIKILDENEFSENSVKFKYDGKLKVVCRVALSELQQMINSRKFPFNDELVYELYDEYCLLNNYTNRKKML